MLLFDVVIVLFGAGVIFRNCYIFMIACYLTSFAYSVHMWQVNRVLTESIGKSQYGHRFLICVRQFLAEHQHHSKIVERSNADFFSGLVFSFTLFTVPGNIFSVYRLMFQRTILFDMTVSLMICLGTYFVMGTYLVSLSIVHGQFYRCVNRIPEAQALLLRHQLNLKMEFDNLMDRLVERRTKMGFSIGPIETITSRVLVEVRTFFLLHEYIDLIHINYLFR